MSVATAVDEVERIRAEEFGPGKEGKLIGAINGVLQSLPDFDELKTAKERAEALAWKGRALAAHPDHAKHRGEAESCLGKAVKMDVKRVDAWCGLGHLLWEAGKLKEALEAYDGALEADPACSKALKDSARVLRRLGGRDNVEKAVARSKECLKKAVSDGDAWYVHGLVLLSKYFCLTMDQADLRGALNAFNLSEKNAKTANPDLYMNRAQCLRYLMQWKEAVVSLRMALQLDPTFKEAKESLDGLAAVLQDLHRKWVTKAGYQSKAISKMLKSLPQTGEQEIAGKKVKVVHVKDLPAKCVETDEPVCVVLRVLELVDDSSVPLLYLALDSTEAPCLVGVYGLGKKAIGSGAELTYAFPKFYRHDVPLPQDGVIPENFDKAWEAVCFVADRSSALLVNGKHVDKSQWTNLSFEVSTPTA
eukprot:Sspe_Gene.11412::Locus_3850_Transcript_1_1_Confidence_1.000_Length_1487::g.11412::m.11412